MPYSSDGRGWDTNYVGPAAVPQEIFTTQDVQKMLNNKFVVVVGDSVQRGIYKDLVVILQSQRRLHPRELKQKGEKSHAGDRLVERSELTNGKHYREVREYKSEDGRHLVRFYFVTRCYSTFMETVMADFWHKPQPDVLIMNSCLWDISRYGCRSMESFKVNLQKVLQRFKKILSPDCLFIWNTTLPIDRKIRGGFLLPDVAFMADVLRRDVLEANFYCQLVVTDYEFDVLDLHYYFRNQIQHRKDDGIHWDEIVHRRITNLILTHMCEAWGLGLPPKRTNLNQVGRQVEVVTGRERDRERGHYGNQYAAGDGWNNNNNYKPRQRIRSSTCDPAYLAGRSVHRVGPSEQHPPQAAHTQHVVELMQQDIINQNLAMQHMVSQNMAKGQEGHLIQGQGQGQGQGDQLHQASVLYQSHQAKAPEDWAANVVISGARNVNIVNQPWADYQQNEVVGAVHRAPSYHRHYKVKPF